MAPMICTICSLHCVVSNDDGEMQDVYLQYVLDIQRIRNFDWATHVVDMCKKSFSLYHTKRRKLIGGCMVLALIWFMEYLQNNVGDLSKLHFSVPLNKNWTSQERLRLDDIWDKTSIEQMPVQETIYGDVEQIRGGPVWEVLHAPREYTALLLLEIWTMYILMCKQAYMP